MVFGKKKIQELVHPLKVIPGITWVVSGGASGKEPNCQAGDVRERCRFDP